MEQIGYVYEGLLDHTAVKATEPTLGLRGKHEPEITLEDLEAQAARGKTHLTKWLRDRTGLSPTQITRALDTAPPDADQERLLLAACGSNSGLAARIAPYFELVRTDERSGQPIVCLPGDWYVTRSEALWLRCFLHPSVPGRRGRQAHLMHSSTTRDLGKPLTKTNGRSSRQM